MKKNNKAQPFELFQCLIALHTDYRMLENIEAIPRYRRNIYCSNENPITTHLKPDVIPTKLTDLSSGHTAKNLGSCEVTENQLKVMALH